MFADLVTLEAGSYSCVAAGDGNNGLILAAAVILDQ
jgi:hypothetical protein